MYASMLAMGALIACVAWREQVWRRWSRKRVAAVLALAVALLVPPLYWRASLQWVLQVACLAGWVWALLRLVTKDQLSDWVLIALLPPIVFGLWQTLAQVVPASALFGVAEQDPVRLGVSVIQVGAERFLRAYGSFPHPNIFGGWLALVLLLTWWRASTHRLLLGLLPLLSLALYPSFSRSAWVALAVGALMLCFYAWKMRDLRHWLRGAVLIGLTFGVAILARPELLFTRIQASTRLESKSINERVVSLEQAWGVLHMHPFGTGMGGYRLGLADLCRAKGCDVPAEPPHLVPVLMLAELGILRMVPALFAVVFVAWNARLKALSTLVWFSPVLVLACFDHYLWSLWSGQALVAVTVAIFWLYQREKTGRQGVVDSHLKEG